MRVSQGLDVIIGALIVWFDYGVISGWQWVYQHNYLCVKTSDGLSQYCGVSWEVNPLPAYIITWCAVVFTVGYIWYLVDYYFLPLNIYFQEDPE
jgi:hypothetical protein